MGNGLSTVAVAGLVLGSVGLTAFWVPEIWNYGYWQIAGGQLSAFVLGASVISYLRGGGR